MLIISRQDAISAGLNKYYTGETCKNGHISERYTLSSVCIECLHPSNVSNSRRANPEYLEISRRQLDLQEKKLALRKKESEERLKSNAEKTTRRQALSSMVKIRLLARAADIDRLYDITWGFARLHNPIIQRADIMTSYVARDSMWVVRCFPADVDNLRATARTLWEQAQMPAPRALGPLPELPESEWPTDDPS